VDYLDDENYDKENGVSKRSWKDAKRRLRRNVRLRIKQGLWEDLREVPKVARSEDEDFN
jgi:hypothetical protein